MSHNCIEGVNRVKPVLFVGIPCLSWRGDRGEVVLQTVFACLPCGRRYAEDEPVGIRELVRVVLTMGF
jgi:hypothetical protein